MDKSSWRDHLGKHKENFTFYLLIMMMMMMMMMMIIIIIFACVRHI